MNKRDLQATLITYLEEMLVLARTHPVALVDDMAITRDVETVRMPSPSGAYYDRAPTGVETHSIKFSLNTNRDLEGNLIQPVRS